MKKFIIELSSLESLQYKEGEKVAKNRFHNGYTPIIGPIEEDKVGDVIKFLKKKKENHGISFLVIEGNIY